MNKTKQELFLELYEPIHDRFERFCRARVYGSMEYRDLMNDALLVAFEKFESLRSNDAFLSFLFSISVRILSNNHQKKKETLHSNDALGFALPDLNSNPQEDADVYFLYKALAQLNEHQKESILLFEISGFSIKEIEKIQGVSESAVKQRLKRGREKLAEILTFEHALLSKEKHHG